MRVACWIPKATNTLTLCNTYCLSTATLLARSGLSVTLHTHTSTMSRPFQITNLMLNSFIFQQYICYTTLLNMFRAARCSSSGGQIVSPQPLVLSLSVNSRTVSSPLSTRILYGCLQSDNTRGCGDTICPPEDEQRAARNMLRSVV